MTAFLRAIPRAFSAARNGDWYGAESIFLAGVFAALGVNRGEPLR
jgi:hypothetical protein